MSWAMVAFEVFHNDKRLCIAGVGDFGVLSAIVTWVAHSPDELKQQTDMTDRNPALFLQVGGLTSRDHYDWNQIDLQVGDEIKIHIVNAAEVDTPRTERADDPAEETEQKKKYVRRLAKELGWEISEPS